MIVSDKPYPKLKNPTIHTFIDTITCICGTVSIYGAAEDGSGNTKIVIKAPIGTKIETVYI